MESKVNKYMLRCTQFKNPIISPSSGLMAVALRAEDVIKLLHVDADKADVSGLKLTLYKVYRYKGQGIGLLVVFNPNGIEIQRGAQIAQLVFIKLTGRTSKPYRGTYQGEVDK
jgi:hypothetical protein